MNVDTLFPTDEAKLEALAQLVKQSTVAEIKQILTAGRTAAYDAGVKDGLTIALKLLERNRPGSIEAQVIRLAIDNPPPLEAP